MSDYKNYNATQYCMPSNYADNVRETNKALGYHDMGNKANTSKQVQSMKGAKVNKQEMGSPDKPGY